MTHCGTAKMKRGFERMLRKVSLMCLILVLLYFLHFLISNISLSIKWASHSSFNKEQLMLDLAATKKIPSNGFFSDYSGYSHPNDLDGVNKTSYAAALAKHSSKVQKSILLAMVDYGSLDFAVNFYETSLKTHNITNYLFVSVNKETCEFLKSLEIACFLYKEDKDASHDSAYYTTDFLRKMNYRTFMILDALKLGYSVLHTDVDVYYLKNPFNVIKCRVHNCDMAILNDYSLKTKVSNYNAGFVFMHATEATIEVYLHMAWMAFHKKYDDQRQLNIALKEVPTDLKIEDRLNVKLRVFFLHKEKFLSGSMYWKDGSVFFHNEQNYPDAIVVHNNWIVTLVAKEYRFKEMLMWSYDKDTYYSNPSRKYLIYTNPVVSTSVQEQQHMELQALKNALAIGQILHRTVILPQFHCANPSQQSMLVCNLLPIIYIKDFYTTFPNHREFTFLLHQKVPKTIKQSLSKVNQIVTKPLGEKLPSFSSNAEIFESKHSKGASSDEIQSWFSRNTESVLVFQSLYDSFSHFSDSKEQEIFEGKLKAGLKSNTYMQRDTPSAIKL